MYKKEIENLKKHYKDSGKPMNLFTQYWIANAETEIAQAEYLEKKSKSKHLKQLVKVGCVGFGCRDYGDMGEEWTSWWVFSAKMNDEAIDKAMYELGVCEHYGGVGQAFCRLYTIYRKGSRVLVSQDGGLDV